MARTKAPCQFCDMRYVQEQPDGTVRSCHSECPQYRAYKSAKAEEALMKKAYLAPLSEQYSEHQTQVLKALRKKHRNYWR